MQYDGTGFHGYQRQAALRSVQQTLEEALEQLDGAPVRLRSSSRTDAGVHARGLPVTFRPTRDIPPHGFLRGANGLLDSDVSIANVARVDEEFDVRHSAGGKRYCYRVWNHPARAALRSRTAWHVPTPLDLDAMREAARPLLGHHDFSAFRASGCQARHAMREVRAIEITREGALICLTFRGNAFLQHMVRILAGSLVDVGRGHADVQMPGRALASRLRQNAGPTAPPHGLTLEQVRYDPAPDWLYV